MIGYLPILIAFVLYFSGVPVAFALIGAFGGYAFGYNRRKKEAEQKILPAEAEAKSLRLQREVVSDN